MWRRGGERPSPGAAKIRHASGSPAQKVRSRPGNGRKSAGVTSSIQRCWIRTAADSVGSTILLVLHDRVRPRTDQRLSTIVVSNCEDRLLVRPLTDLDDLRAVFRVSDRTSMDVQPVSDVCVHRYLLQPSQCLAAMAGATGPHDPGRLATWNLHAVDRRARLPFDAGTPRPPGRVRARRSGRVGIRQRARATPTTEQLQRDRELGARPRRRWRAERAPARTAAY